MTLDHSGQCWSCAVHTAARTRRWPRHKGEKMSYPLLDIFWTILEFFLWLVWIWVFVMVIFDIFRSHDLSGWAKALWVLFVAIIPLIGVLVYLIVRGGSMHERQGARR